MALQILENAQTPAAGHTEHVTLTAANLDHYYPESRWRRVEESPGRERSLFAQRIPAAV
jgi:hypothetical protein